LLQTTLTDNQDERFYVFRVATKHPPLSSTHNKKLCAGKRGERANDSDAKNDDSLLDGFIQKVVLAVAIPNAIKIADKLVNS